MASKDKILASAQKNLQKGQIPKAIKDYQKLVEMDPRDTRNRQKLAELYSRAQRNEEALQEYEHVAGHYSGRGFYLKAIAVYKQMQKLAPEKADTYFQLADLNKKQGLIGNALAELRTLVTIHEKAENISETIKVLEAMRELDPENMNIRVKVAETYAKNQLNEKAFAELEELSTTFRSTGDPDKLLKLYEIFLPLYPTNLKIKIGAADALVRKGLGQKALTLLQGILSEHPEDPEILKTLAAAYRVSGDHENELLTYKHLLKLQPKDLDLRESFLRACLAHKSETDRIIESLNAWQDDFLAAGREENLRDFCKVLLETVPGDDRVEGLAARLGMESEIADEDLGGEPGEPEKTVLPVEEEQAGEEQPIDEARPSAGAPSASEPEEADKPSAGEPPGTAEAEEIPLDFLQQVAREQPADISEGVEAPEKVAPTEAPATKGEVEAESSEESEPDIQPLPGDSGEGEPASGEEEPEGDAAFSDDLVEMEIELEFDDVSPEAKFDETETVSADGSASDNLAPQADHDGRLSEAEEGGEGGEEASLLDLEEVVPESEIEPIEDVVEESATGDVEDDLEELEEIVDVVKSEPDAVTEEQPVEELVELETEIPPDSEEETSPLTEDLEEVEFYLRQGLLDDAERVCRNLQKQYPGSEEIEERLDTVLRTRMDQENQQPEESGGFFDLGSEVIEEIEEEVGDFLEESVPEKEDSFNLDGFFSDSQKGVETEIAAEDTESHYNLGIAYKEMGLLEEAIAEFDQASGSPQRRIDCLTLKGLCLIQQGNPAEAEEALRTALAEPDLPQDKEVNLNFELGLLFQAADRHEEALKCFQRVSERDHFFREVGEKISELEAFLGNIKEQKKEESDSKDKRDRISYV